MKLVLYRDRKRQLRWRLLAANGRILANAGEGYRRRADMVSAMIAVFGDLDRFPMEDQTKARRR